MALLFIGLCLVTTTFVVLTLLGKMDFFIGRTLRMDVYGSLRRKRLLSAASLVLTAISLFFFVYYRDEHPYASLASALCTFAGPLLGVLDWRLSEKDRQAHDMNPVFVSRMMQNEKYNLSRVNKLLILTTMALGAGLIVIHFFAWNVLYMKIFFALYVMLIIAIGILSLTWAKKK